MSTACSSHRRRPAAPPDDERTIVALAVTTGAWVWHLERGQRSRLASTYLDLVAAGTAELDPKHWRWFIDLGCVRADQVGMVPITELSRLPEASRAAAIAMLTDGHDPAAITSLSNLDISVSELHGVAATI